MPAGEHVLQSTESAPKGLHPAPLVASLTHQRFVIYWYEKPAQTRNHAPSTQMKPASPLIRVHAPSTAAWFIP